jgi:hypothetical protein
MNAATPTGTVAERGSSAPDRSGVAEQAQGGGLHCGSAALRDRDDGARIAAWHEPARIVSAWAAVSGRGVDGLGDHGVAVRPFHRRSSTPTSAITGCHAAVGLIGGRLRETRFGQVQDRSSARKHPPLPDMIITLTTAGIPATAELSAVGVRRSDDVPQQNGAIPDGSPRRSLTLLVYEARALDILSSLRAHLLRPQRSRHA